MTIAVGSSSGQAPFTRTVIANSLNSVSAPASQSLGGSSYDFSSWSDSGAATHDLTAPASDATYTATYSASGGSSPPPPPPPPPSAPAPVPPAPTLDLGVTLIGPAKATVGQTVEYTVHLAATGSASAKDVGVTLAVPPALAVAALPPTCSSAQSVVVCHPLGAVTGGDSESFVVTFTAVAAGSETVRASVASSQAADANSANNSSTVSTSITNVASKLTTKRPELTPVKPKHGKAFVVSIAVVRAASGATVHPTHVSCSARVASHAVRAVGSSRAGRASCRLTIPPTARHGAAINVVLTATLGSQRISKRFAAHVG